MYYKCNKCSLKTLKEVDFGHTIRGDLYKTCIKCRIKHKQKLDKEREIIRQANRTATHNTVVDQPVNEEISEGLIECKRFFNYDPVDVEDSKDNKHQQCNSNQNRINLIVIILFTLLAHFALVFNSLMEKRFKGIRDLLFNEY